MLGKLFPHKMQPISFEHTTRYSFNFSGTLLTVDLPPENPFMDMQIPTLTANIYQGIDVHDEEHFSYVLPIYHTGWQLFGGRIFSNKQADYSFGVSLATPEDKSIGSLFCTENAKAFLLKKTEAWVGGWEATPTTEADIKVLPNGAYMYHRGINHMGNPEYTFYAFPISNHVLLTIKIGGGLGSGGKGFPHEKWHLTYAEMDKLHQGLVERIHLELSEDAKRQKAEALGTQTQ